MKYPVCSIRDIKTGFMAPTLDINVSSAVRAFGHAIANSPDVLGTFPGDFSLFQVAEFDTDTGLIEPVWPVLHLVDGDAALKGVSSHED